MNEVPYVQKTFSQDLHYSFAGERAFLEALRPAMIRHGIDVFPSSMEVLSDGEYRTSNDKRMARVVILATYIFTHGNSNTHQTVVTIGEAADVADKALSKAMTQALKYALRQWALVETGDDPDTVAEQRGTDYSEPIARCLRAMATANDEQALAKLLSRANSQFGKLPEAMAGINKTHEKRITELRTSPKQTRRR